jgi:threonine synthase
VQSEYCDPFIKAVQVKAKSAALDTAPRPTMAEGIAIGVPMRSEEILEYIYKYGIQLIAAPGDKILEARMALAAKGIYCEHTTAANYAAYLKYCEVYGKTSDCLIPMCGAGLKSDH